MHAEGQSGYIVSANQAALLLPHCITKIHAKMGGHVIGQDCLSSLEIQQYFPSEIRKGL